VFFYAEAYESVRMPGDVQAFGRDSQADAAVGVFLRGDVRFLSETSSICPTRVKDTGARLDEVLYFIDAFYRAGKPVHDCAGRLTWERPRDADRPALI